jgi:S1-C subfamily serine protease
MVKFSALGLALWISLGMAVSGLCEDMLAVEREMTRVVSEVGESIVSVSAVTSVPQAASRSGLPDVLARARSVGCGVVFDESGLILSTASVVGYARYVDITTISGVEHRGTVVGIDPVSDVAVIKVEASDLKPARFAKGVDLRPGSLVLVLGNAFGTLPSVSMGVLSNVTGTLASQEDQRMLRLAVPINPGDIGGPVVSSAGEVVGIVIGRLTFQPQTHSVQVGDRAILGFSGSPQASNMSIAIPADRAMAVAQDIMEKGSTRRGFLGVQVMDLSEQLKHELGDQSLTGVMVTSVVPGSPAESVGILPGDVITSFGSRSIATVGTLGDAVGKVAPGDVVDIRYLRGRESLRDGVRIGWFVPEFVRQATFIEDPQSAEQMRSRIEDLKAEMQRLEKQLGDLEDDR